MNERSSMIDQDSNSQIGDCILFSTADWDEPYWTNKQHTARVLAELGWRVLYIESVGLRSPKMTSKRDWLRLARRLWCGVRGMVLGPQLRDRNIWVFSPLVVPAKHHWPLIAWLNRHLLQLTVGRFIRKHSFQKPLIWTYHPFMLELVENIEHGAIVFHCVDNIRAVPGVDAGVYKRAEIELLKRCLVVFTTAQALKEHCIKYNPNTYNLSNVVDAKHFNNRQGNLTLPNALGAISEPRLVYHGVLSDFKLDFQLLLQTVKIRPEWQWVFIGEEREGQTSEWVSLLRREPNTHFLGHRNYQELPPYLHGMNVGILPTLVNEYTHSMFPMKYYEYLAAGLPVVSTPLAFTRHVSNGLEVGGSPEEFVMAVEQQLDRGLLTPDEVQQYIGDNTWEDRLRKMLARIKSLESSI